MHAWTVGIEDADDLDVGLVLAVIVEEQGLRATLTFVVAAANADRIDAPPIRLRLRVNVRIAVDLRRGCLQDASFDPLRQPQHVDRTVNAGLGGLHWVELVVNGRRGTGEIEDALDLDVEREGNVVAHHLEQRMVQDRKSTRLNSSHVRISYAVF